jgi:Flp pilus assembly pilin Flp
MDSKNRRNIMSIKTEERSRNKNGQIRRPNSSAGISRGSRRQKGTNYAWLWGIIILAVIIYAISYNNNISSKFSNVSNNTGNEFSNLSNKTMSLTNDTKNLTHKITNLSNKTKGLSNKTKNLTNNIPN